MSGNDLRFITNEPALLLGDALVIAELHIGYETELYRKGFSVQSNTGDMLDRIRRLITETGAEELIVVGDLKHGYQELTYQEKEEVPKFLEELAERVEVHLVPGNHDSLIKEILPEDIEFHSQRGWKKGDTYLCHGHAWPAEEVCDCSRLIAAHLHPTVEFIDEMGFRSVESCWLRGNVDKEALAEKYDRDVSEIDTELGIVVPAFNHLAGGVPVNSEEEAEESPEKEISPLTRNKVFNVAEMDVYLLDGTHLGRAGKIETNERGEG